MALEEAVLFQLRNNLKDTTDVFGCWEYISHQVPASPFKPIDYMDRIDVFGYRYIPGYNTISKYWVMELKTDVAAKDDIEQMLKYADWIREEYAFRDYPMIEAFSVADDFSDDVVNHAKNAAERNYTIGRRTIRSGRWDNLKLVKYSYDNQLGEFKFNIIK
jgi:hypothetical protein